jgi:hypothetical protein
VQVTSLPTEISITTAKDCFDWFVLICTVALTIVGIVGTAIGVKTLGILKDHADHFYKLAEATSLNAKALINSERPWVDVIPIEVGPGEWRFEATNHGRTPAEIVSTCCRFEIKLIDGLTEPPLYKDRAEPYKRFIFPRESPPVPVGTMPITMMLAACPQESDVLSGAQTFVIVGRVVYYDVLNRIGPPHETRYCYGWNFRDNSLFSMGPSEYHGHT